MAEPSTVRPMLQSDLLAQFARIATHLVLIIVAIAITIWLIRRVGRYQQSTMGNIRVCETLLVGAREKLILVEVGHTQLLVGITPNRMETLHVLRESIDYGPPPAPPSMKAFAQTLAEKCRQGPLR